MSTHTVCFYTRVSLRHKIHKRRVKFMPQKLPLYLSQCHLFTDHERATSQLAAMAHMTPLVYYNTQHVSSGIVNAQIQLLVLTLDTLFIHVQMVENKTGIKFHEVLQKNIYKCSIYQMSSFQAVMIPQLTCSNWVSLSGIILCSGCLHSYTTLTVPNHTCPLA